MVKAKKWILAEKFGGEPKDSNFRLEEEELPEPKDGEFICEAVFLSVDPYMRSFNFPVGKVLICEQVARVTESKNSEYPVGILVQLYCGWRSHTLVNPQTADRLLKVPDVGDKSPSVVMGVAGMPGMAAYFGLLEFCQPQPGETMLVNGVGGAVGSLAGQIAKIKGCKVIGFAGTKEKCDWARSLGFDHVFNYREVGVDEALKQAAPDGVDCFFDNVGGEFMSKVIPHMRLFGRVSVCGSSSTYNDTEKAQVRNPFEDILFKQLTVRGFIVRRWWDRYPEGKTQILKWIDEGKIKFRETIRDGFDNMPRIFMALLKGENTGKMIVRA